MRRVIASTVGTSLSSNWARAKGKENPGLDELVSFIGEDNKNCAETNSLKELKPKPEFDQLCFLSSDTAGGQLCMQALERYYAEQGFCNIIKYVIPGLNDNYYDFENRGLKNLLDILSDIYEESRGRELVINATAGYKAQTSYATLFGIIFGVEVVYLFENFTGLVRFPPMPLCCNPEILKTYKEQFSEILKAPSKKEARQFLKGLPEPLRRFFRPAQGCYEFSPLGKLLFQTAANRRSFRYPVRTYKSHATIWGHQISSIDEIPDEEVREMLYRIFDISDAVTDIYFDESSGARNDETLIQYVDTVNHALRYLIKTPLGSNYIKIGVIPGQEKEVLRRLGRRIYP